MLASALVAFDHDRSKCLLLTQSGHWSEGELASQIGEVRFAILALAKQGERDPDRLRAGALAILKVGRVHGARFHSFQIRIMNFKKREPRKTSHRHYINRCCASFQS